MRKVYIDEFGKVTSDDNGLVFGGVNIGWFFKIEKVNPRVWNVRQVESGEIVATFKRKTDARDFASDEINAMVREKKEIVFQ